MMQSKIRLSPAATTLDWLRETMVGGTTSAVTLTYVEYSVVPAILMATQLYQPVEEMVVLQMAMVFGSRWSNTQPLI